ncbi:MAG: gamma-glutamyl-gamma-aminobutyrate hydrolase family protein [Parachlamydia sp.]|nr:gamma-glutamyl-gamma-aminobutyrate hydrolase family protein [Parachlamydia sp.]
MIIDNQGGLTFKLFHQVVACTRREVIIVPHASLSIVQSLDPEAIILSSHPGTGADTLVNLIQHFSSRIPILGISLGMRALVEAFGGKVIKAARPVYGKSSLAYHHQSQHYENVPSPFIVGCYYAYVVDEASLPNHLQIEARTAEGVIMGISHRELPCYGVQFNPESMLTLEGAKILENFIQHV